jgi:hypothetical protein
MPCWSAQTSRRACGLTPGVARRCKTLYAIQRVVDELRPSGSAATQGRVKDTPLTLVHPLTLLLTTRSSDLLAKLPRLEFRRSCRVLTIPAFLYMMHGRYLTIGDDALALSPCLQHCTHCSFIGD